MTTNRVCSSVPKTLLPAIVTPSSATTQYPGVVMLSPKASRIANLYRPLARHMFRERRTNAPLLLW